MQTEEQTPENQVQAEADYVAIVIMKSLCLPRAELEEEYRQLAYAEYRREHPDHQTKKGARPAKASRHQ